MRGGGGAERASRGAVQAPAPENRSRAVQERVAHAAVGTQTSRARRLVRGSGGAVNLGISIDGAQARSVMVDAGGAVVARARADQGEPNHAILEAAREALASVPGVMPDAVGVSF